MKYGSVCSGIEAASVAWEPLGWQPEWFAEIEPFPSAVLAHHWPEVSNLGDMTSIALRVLRGDVAAPAVLVGGTPCQAFSVAGMREGLRDERGQLTIKFVELADAIDAVRDRDGKPEAIIVWENVPGVLSDKENAFGCFLGALAGEDCELQPSGKRWTNAGCVYGPQRAVAWRVLDAQYFGVAQRRRRVFVVASARAGFDPAAVLFEREGVRRDTAPSREAGEGFAADVAPSLVSSGRGVERTGETRGQDPVVAVPIKGFRMAAFGEYVDDGTASTAKARDYKAATDLAVTVALRGREGGATAELGGEVATALRASTGGGDKPHVLTDTCYNKGISHNEEQINARPQKADAAKALRTLRETVGEKAFTQWGLGILDSLQPPEILRQAVHGCSVRRQACEGESGLDDCTLPRQETGAARTLLEMREAGRQRRTPQGRGLAEQCARELGAHLSKLSQQRASSTAFLQNLREASEGIGVLQQALSAIQEMGRPSHDQDQSAHTRLAVRRLTPKEAERLQGFPDGHTNVPYRNKPAADGPRYKAIGNSMAVPVMRWIGERITAVDAEA